METSHSVFYVDTTNILSSYFMTVDMHRLPFMRIVYSGNQFFRVGPNISEKFVPGGTNFRGIQIKCDTSSKNSEADQQRMQKDSKRDQMTVRELAHVVGVLAVLPAPLHYQGFHQPLSYGSMVVLNA